MNSNYRTSLPRCLAIIIGLFCVSPGLITTSHAASSVTLAWDPNPEPDIAGYHVLTGTASGVYTEKLDVGNNTTATVSNLSGSSLYFFAVSAYNTAGLESLPSKEVSLSPNETPIAVNDTISTDEGTSATISVLSNDSDPDNGPSTLAIQSVGSAVNGTTSVSGTSVTYAPAPGFYGTDSFSYTITDGALTASATVTVNVVSTAIAGNLVSVGLTGSNIGTATGSSRILSDKSWELIAAGTGVTGLSDSVHLESAKQTGNFQALVRILSLTSDGAAPQAGLMLRESTAANARFAMLAATPNGYAYGARTIAGGSAFKTNVALSAPYPDVWLLIERNGDTIDFATSINGATFDFAGSTVIASLANEVTLGLFAASGTQGVSARAVVSDFMVIDMVSGSDVTGLTARYYVGKNFETLALTRVENVNFDWGSGPPDPILPINDFSVRWEGQVEPLFSETYTFSTVSDDGVRLWVNGVLLINNWSDHAATENKGSIILTAGRKYDIKMEFYEHTAVATAKLSWSSPNQPKEIIPESALSPDNLQSGLTGRYYVGKNFETLALTRVENVNFDWGSGAPDPAVPDNDFSVRWEGQVEPVFSETYTFSTVSDDGVRLWVNGVLLINNWSDHAPTENAGFITLTAGRKYDIKMEFYENGGRATAKLSWSSPRQPKEIIPVEALYSLKQE